MIMRRSNPADKSSGWRWKLPLAVFVLMAAVLAGAMLFLDDMALDQINSALTRHLTAGGRLEAIDIDLVAGRVELSGMTISAPEGHGTTPLLALPTLILDIDPMSLTCAELVVEELVLKGPQISLQRDVNGQTGLDRLIKSDETTLANRPVVKPEESIAASGEKDQKVLLVKTIRLEDGAIAYQDSALTGKPMEFLLQEIVVQVSQLRLFDDNHTADPASIAATGQLKQLDELPAAHYGVVAHVGPVGQGIPAINAQSRMIGLKLDTLGALLPPATRTALGGDGLDAGMALALNQGRIRIDAQAVTDRNVRYDTIQVRGPVDAPVVALAPVMTGVFRVKDGVLNIGKQGFGAGIHIAESGVDAALKAGSGVLQAGKKFLGGVFDSGKGLLTLDHKKVKSGLVDATAGTIGDSLYAVEGTGDIAGLGLDRSLSRLTGKAAVQQWEQDIAQRFQTAMQGARKALSNMAYPPVTD